MPNITRYDRFAELDAHNCTRARGVAAGEQGGAARVAGQADNVGLAATDRCHVAWQSLAASLERFPFRWNRARTIIACPIDQRRGSI